MKWDGGAVRALVREQLLGAVDPLSPVGPEVGRKPLIQSDYVSPIWLVPDYLAAA